MSSDCLLRWSVPHSPSASLPCVPKREVAINWIDRSLPFRNTQLSFSCTMLPLSVMSCGWHGRVEPQPSLQLTSIRSIQGLGPFPGHPAAVQSPLPMGWDGRYPLAHPPIQVSNHIDIFGTWFRIHSRGNRALPALSCPSFLSWKSRHFHPPPILTLDPLTSGLILPGGLVVCVLSTCPSNRLLHGLVTDELFQFSLRPIPKVIMGDTNPLIAYASGM